MSFLHPQLLWLLLLPAALLLACLRFRARTVAALPQPRIPRAQLRQGALIPGPNLRSPRPIVACAALAALVLALARPQGATLATPTVTQARDVLVAVDVSRSMLSDDVAPSRLARARLLINALADELRGERLGLLPFAGTAFLQCPLSADYEIFRTFLEELGPDMIPAGGSDFTALLTAADEAFGPADSTSPDAPSHADRYLIILSDGEAQDDTWKPLAQKLSGRGVRILALGLGTADGALVPDGKGGVAKKPDGSAVLSRLNASTLQDLARLTDGAYRDASVWVDLAALLRETVARGRAVQTTTDTAPRREELFAWFLAPALVLLALALVREFPVTARPGPLRPPKLPVRHAASLGFLLALLGTFAVDRPVLAAATPAETPDPLVDLVGRLAAADSPSPAELSRLAALTAEQGEKARAENKPGFPEGALRDGLAAIEQGRAADPSAADWTALRRRLEALLAPPPKPPEPPKSDQNQKQNDSSENDPQKSPQDDQKSQNESKSDEAKSDETKNDGGKADEDKNNSPGSPQKSPGEQGASPEKPEKDGGQSQEQQSGSSSASEGQSPKPDSKQPPQNPASQPLGELGEKPDEKPPSPETSEAAPEDRPPEPTQRAGGVSASGQSSDDKDKAAATPGRIDPTLVVPQQRLERVRDADSPARLYQLLQEAETSRRSDTPTRDW